MTQHPKVYPVSAMEILGDQSNGTLTLTSVVTNADMQVGILHITRLAWSMHPASPSHGRHRLLCLSIVNETYRNLVSDGLPKIDMYRIVSRAKAIQRLYSREVYVHIPDLDETVLGCSVFVGWYRARFG